MTEREFTRRAMLAATGAAAALAACGAEPPAAPALLVTASGQAGMNPGPDGSDRPVILSVVQMRGTAGFEAADPAGLRDPATALGADFIRVDQIALAPGATVEQAIAVDPGAAAIGVVGGFRSSDGKVFKRLVPVPAGPVPLAITVGPGGIAV